LEREIATKERKERKGKNMMGDWYEKGEVPVFSTVAATVPVMPLPCHRLSMLNEGIGFPGQKPQSPLPLNNPNGFAVAVRWRLRLGSIRINCFDHITRSFTPECSSRDSRRYRRNLHTFFAVFAFFCSYFVWTAEGWYTKFALNWC
jgi:hypothetical protein